MSDEIILTSEMILDMVRIIRDNKIKEFLSKYQWIYDREFRQERLNRSQRKITKQQLKEMDEYVEALCDLPDLYPDITSLSEVVYPVEPTFLDNIKKSKVKK